MRSRTVAACATLALALWWPDAASAQEWFDDYARGLQALAQGQPARAVELFERAIRKRPEPGANLITYGTNRLDRYHPYLRLAEAHLAAGRAEAAREALRRSEQRGREPAGERARLSAQVEALLEKERAAAATPAPAPAIVAVSPPASALPSPAPVAATPAPSPAPPPASTGAPRMAPGAGGAGASGPADVELAPLVRPAQGTVEIRSAPPGASVFSRGRLLGTTPLAVDLPAGTQPLTLRREGAADESFSVLVEEGRRVTVERTLVATGPVVAPSPAPQTPREIAALVVYSDPPGAAVYLDDEPLGETDPGSGRLVKSGVAPGPHRVRLARAGHHDSVHEVDVASFGPTTVRGILAPVPRPDYTLPLSALAVAVASALGGYALFRRRGHPARGGTGGLRPPESRTTTLGTPSPRRTRVAPATQADGAAAPRPGPADAETAAIGPVTPPSASGVLFGEYRLVEQIGRGGMAAVYRAERGGEVCALKRPLPGLLEDREFRERFLREAEIGRTLHHPNIIRIFERGQVDGVPFFTMELVEGETLAACLKRDGALPPRASARVVAQVAEALDYAHLKGVIHRDLKPSNIMVLADADVKVMDYGIARARRFEGLTVTGAFLGTPDYVAPETAEGKGTDARSDLYSLGIVFYEVLTGKKPFVGDTPFATIKKHCTEPPTPPSVVSPGVPRQLEAIVLRLLPKDPADRYPGAEDLLIELREYLNRAA